MAENNREPASSVASPCVRNCCLDAQDICLGCHRSIAEIMHWNEASEDERREILLRCARRAQQRRDNTGGASSSRSGER